MTTVEEIIEFKKRIEEEYGNNTGKDKIWGKPDIPKLLLPHGEFLYEDRFENIDNRASPTLGNFRRLHRKSPDAQLSCQRQQV